MKKYTQILKIVTVTFGFLLTLTNCEINNEILNEKELAKTWFDKNFDSKIKNNSFYKGELSWDEAFVADDNSIFVPIESDENLKNKLVLKSNDYIDKEINFQAYVILKEKNQNNFILKVRVYVDENNSLNNNDFNRNKAEFPFFEFANTNELLNSSFNIFDNREVQSFSQESCVVVDWFLITNYSDGSYTEEYVGSTVECGNSEGLGGANEGGGGSSEDCSFGYIKNDNGECVEKEDKVCIQSFEFTDVGTNWQNAGVSDVNVQFLTLGTVLALQNVHFQELHFGLPKLTSNGTYITNHNARYEARDIMTQAEELTNIYQSLNPTSTAIQLKAYFLEQLQEISALQGGTVSTSAPLGWTGQLKEHQSYFLSATLECD